MTGARHDLPGVVDSEDTWPHKPGRAYLVRRLVRVELAPGEDPYRQLGVCGGRIQAVYARGGPKGRSWVRIGRMCLRCWAFWPEGEG